jgi:uroporphyrinogen-III synthase
VAGSLAEAFPVASTSPLAGTSKAASAAGKADDPATVLFPRAETVQADLAGRLREKGWQVDEVVAYRTAAADPGPERTAAARQAEAIAFTSSSTVDRSVQLLGPSGIPPVVVTIGPVTSASARARGLAVAVEASPHTIDGLVAAVAEALGGPPPVGG